MALRFFKLDAGRSGSHEREGLGIRRYFAAWAKEMAIAGAGVRNGIFGDFGRLFGTQTTPLQSAAREFVEAWVRLLLQHGVDLGRLEEGRRLVRNRGDAG